MGRASSDFASALPSNPASREATDYFSSQSTSGLQTPAEGEKKHIRFDDKVEQCIAVDIKDGDYDDDYQDEDSWDANRDSDDSSDDGVVMMKKSKKRRPVSRRRPRSSFTGGESKTIAKLPSTTLKYRTDSPDVTEASPPQSHSVGGIWRGTKLSPSPSQETLRPSHPSNNFLLDEEDDEADISWEPSGAFADGSGGLPISYDVQGISKQDETSSPGGLRRTPSGIFIQTGDDDDEIGTPGLLGKVENAVNTAKDIAHVIWNVGWKKTA